jgi:hypothetical protein
MDEAKTKYQVSGLRTTAWTPLPRTLNPQVSGSNPEGRTKSLVSVCLFSKSSAKTPLGEPNGEPRSARFLLAHVHLRQAVASIRANKSSHACNVMWFHSSSSLNAHMLWLFKLELTFDKPFSSYLQRRTGDVRIVSGVSHMTHGEFYRSREYS